MGTCEEENVSLVRNAAVFHLYDTYINDNLLARTSHNNPGKSEVSSIRIGDPSGRANSRLSPCTHGWITLVGYTCISGVFEETFYKGRYRKQLDVEPPGKHNL